MYINVYTQFTGKVCITHIWKKDACVLWYTHVKTLVCVVWLSKQTLLSEGGSELWEINELMKSKLLTLMVWENSSGATEQQNRTKQKSKKHFSLKIFRP